jgi:hypothetical protein
MGSQDGTAKVPAAQGGVLEVVKLEDTLEFFFDFRDQVAVRKRAV